MILQDIFLIFTTKTPNSRKVTVQQKVLHLCQKVVILKYLIYNYFIIFGTKNNSKFTILRR